MKGGVCYNDIIEGQMCSGGRRRDGTVRGRKPTEEMRLRKTMMGRDEHEEETVSL